MSSIESAFKITDHFAKLMQCAYEVELQFTKSCDELYDDANDMIGFLFNFTQDLRTCTNTESFSAESSGEISIIPLLSNSSERPVLNLCVLILNIRDSEHIRSFLNIYKERFSIELIIRSIEPVSDCPKIFDDLRLKVEDGELDVFEAGVAIICID